MGFSSSRRMPQGLFGMSFLESQDVFSGAAQFIQGHMYSQSLPHHLAPAPPTQNGWAANPFMQSHSHLILQSSSYELFFKKQYSINNLQNS